MMRILIRFPRAISFFFQAEDGIRDWSVTGVQTCALPICLVQDQDPRVVQDRPRILILDEATSAVDTETERSEERRVGKEGRAWGAEIHEKKKGATAMKRRVKEEGPWKRHERGS